MLAYQPSLTMYTCISTALAIHGLVVHVYRSVQDVAKMTTIHQSRSESLLAIDEMIGRFLDLLTAGVGKQGTLANTFFFFTSDNVRRALSPSR